MLFAHEQLHIYLFAMINTDYFFFKFAGQLLYHYFSTNCSVFPKSVEHLPCILQHRNHSSVDSECWTGVYAWSQKIKQEQSGISCCCDMDILLGLKFIILTVNFALFGAMIYEFVLYLNFILDIACILIFKGNFKMAQ